MGGVARPGRAASVRASLLESFSWTASVVAHVCRYGWPETCQLVDVWACWSQQFEPPPDAAYTTSTNRFARYSARFRLRTIHTTATNTTRTPPAKPPLAPDVMSLSPCETAHTHMARYTTMSVRPMANSRPDRLDHIAPTPVLIVLPAYVTPNEPMVHIRQYGRSFISAREHEPVCAFTAPDRVKWLQSGCNQCLRPIGRYPGNRCTPCRAGVAEMADAPGLGPGGETRGGSSPLARTDL